MSTTEQLTWNGKSWRELSKDEWTLLRRTDEALFMQLSMEMDYDEGRQSRPRKAVAPVEVIPAPAPDFVTRKEVYEQFYTVTENKEYIHTVIKKVIDVVGDALKKRDEHIKNLESRVKALEAKPSSKSSNGDSTRIASLESRLAPIEKRLADQDGIIQAQRRHIESLEKKIGGVINAR